MPSLFFAHFSDFTHKGVKREQKLRNEIYFSFPSLASFAVKRFG